MKQEAAANLIYACRRLIAETVAKQHFKQHPELATCYGDGGWEKCIQDTEYHCMHLAEAVRFDEEVLFHDSIAWAKVFLASRGVKEDDLRDNLDGLLTALREAVPGESQETAAACIAGAIRELPRMPNTIGPFVEPDAPLGELAGRYLALLLANNRRKATELILKEVAEGVPMPDIFNHVFAPCLKEVGRLWQINKINEAQEHFCSEATQAILAMLSTHFEPSQPRRTVLGFCVAGERHTLGIRMVLDSFELNGWDAVCLGADVPTDNLPSALLAYDPKVVLISATMIYHLSEVRKAIAVIRNSSPGIMPLILAGGHPFELSPRLWRKVGADAPPGDYTTINQLAQDIRPAA